MEKHGEWAEKQVKKALLPDTPGFCQMFLKAEPHGSLEMPSLTIEQMLQKWSPDLLRYNWVEYSMSTVHLARCADGIRVHTHSLTHILQSYSRDWVTQALRGNLPFLILVHDAANPCTTHPPILLSSPQCTQDINPYSTCTFHNKLIQLNVAPAESWITLSMVPIIPCSLSCLSPRLQISLQPLASCGA